MINFFLTSMNLSSNDLFLIVVHSIILIVSFHPCVVGESKKGKQLTYLSFCVSIFVFLKQGRNTLRAPPSLHQPPTDGQDTETASVSILGNRTWL